MFFIPFSVGPHTLVSSPTVTVKVFIFNVVSVFFHRAEKTNVDRKVLPAFCFFLPFDGRNWHLKGWRRFRNGDKSDQNLSNVFIFINVILSLIPAAKSQIHLSIWKPQKKRKTWLMQSQVQSEPTTRCWLQKTDSLWHHNGLSSSSSTVYWVSSYKSVFFLS